MIDLYTWHTPNGRKVSIMLEEIGMAYNVFPINIAKDEQFQPHFLEVSPNNRIPAIVDKENNNYSLFESGAILMYLAEKSGKYLNSNNRNIVTQWLMAQMGYVGPILGQHHQFHHYNPGKSKFGEERYFRISRSIYKDLDNRLSNSKYLAGNDYSIADIATWPWIARHDWHDIGLKNHAYLCRWYEDIANRSAVKRGYDYLNKGEKIPMP